MCISGDNMLTALSVARDCGMIERKDKVILAMVTPPIGTQPPSVEWTYAEDAKRNVTEIQTIRQVKHFVTTTMLPNYGLFPPTETDPCTESFPDRYIVLCRTFSTGTETETETFPDRYCKHFRDGSPSQGQISIPILLYFNKGIGISPYQWKNLLSTAIHVRIHLRWWK